MYYFKIIVYTHYYSVLVSHVQHSGQQRTRPEGPWARYWVVAGGKDAVFDVEEWHQQISASKDPSGSLWEGGELKVRVGSYTQGMVKGHRVQVA